MRASYPSRGDRKRQPLERVTERLLRTRDVAELLRLSCETVLRWHRSGKLPGGRRLGSNVLRFNAGFAATLPERFRYSVMGAFRQTCEAGVRYGYMARNPAKLAGSNPMPAPSAVRVYTPKELVYELARIMGTSVGMIEAHYGALLDTARESLLERLEAIQ